MRNHVLVRADVEGYRYADVLEVRPGRVRLIHPSKELRQSLRWGFVAVVLAWLFIANPLTYYGLAALFQRLAWPVPWALPIATVLWVASVLAAAMSWDRRNLPVLADNTPNATDVKVLGMTSFWTFQEIRAAAPGGEMRITVQGSERKVGRVLRSAGVWPTASG